MRGAFLLLGVLLAGGTWAFDPPRIIGVLTSPQNESYGYAGDFCNIGDIDSDGDDDLLVSQLNFENLDQSRAYVYRGGDTIRNNPFFTFSSDRDGHIVADAITYFGHIQGREALPVMGITFIVPSESQGVNFHILSNQLSNEPIVAIQGGEDYYPSFFPGHKNHPCDLNGDNFDDVIYRRPTGGLQVCYGGEDFDTLSDWSLRLWPLDITAGVDLNGDDYDDLLILTNEEEGFVYSIYLGGIVPDTIPVVRVPLADFDLTGKNAMLPDINGDGYDEWGVSYWFVPNPDDQRREDEGFYIFMGSDQPDGQPDLILEGTPDRWLSGGEITGGDFNGDGYGDIVVKTGGSDEDHGQAVEMQFHFGNRWIADYEGKRPADLFLNFGREYDGDIAHDLGGELGAVGDYNGDEADDFVWGTTSRRAIVFAGNRDWRVDVPKETEIPSSFLLSLSSAPNPFNGETTITYSLSHPANVNLTLFDLQGRLVKHLVEGDLTAGDHKIIVSDLQSGLYFVLLQSQNQRLIRKIVCLK